MDSHMFDNLGRGLAILAVVIAIVAFLLGIGVKCACDANPYRIQIVKVENAPA